MLIFWLINNLEKWKIKVNLTVKMYHKSIQMCIEDDLKGKTSEKPQIFWSDKAWVHLMLVLISCIRSKIDVDEQL